MTENSGKQPHGNHESASRPRGADCKVHGIHECGLRLYSLGITNTIYPRYRTRTCVGNTFVSV